jgi:hypothetical protein
MPDVRTNVILTKGEANGLAAVAAELVKDPNRLRAALIIYDAKRGTEDYDVHDTVITVRIRRVENLLPQDLDAAEVMIRRALEKRSGQAVLELELEDEIRRTFQEMADPESPEDPEEGGQGKSKGKK